MHRISASTVLAGVAVSSLLGLLACLVVLRPPAGRLWGDEGTFVAMTASLVRDGDLAFGEADLEWAKGRRPGPAPTVILQRTARGITYSKPVLYPLLSAPLYAVMGESGLVVTNLLALALALALAWRFLRSLGPPRRAVWVLLTFVCCSVLLAYIGWKMSDTCQAALTLAGLVLALAPVRSDLFRSRTAAVVGGVLLGCAVNMRFTAAALAGTTVLALLLYGRWRRASVIGGLAVLSFLTLGATSQILLGTANPYKAERSSFNDSTGYPAGAESDAALTRFIDRPATQSATWHPALDLRRTAYSTLYFLIGRHTGVLVYFPAALVLVLQLLRRPDRLGLSMMAGVSVVVAFYLLWMPHNYFGGSTFIGNRYFLGVFPALLVGLPLLPTARLASIGWGIGLVMWASALTSVARVGELDRSSQSHTRAGIFRALPFESTAQNIDGLRERFWADDYVRFLDPYTQPARWSFRLDSDHPAAELMIVTGWPGEKLLFVVMPEKGPVELAVRDWGRQSRFTLPQDPPAPGGLIEVSTSGAWRRHSFPWGADRLHRAHAIRFSLEPAGVGPVTAVVRYLGRGYELTPLSADLLQTELPREAPAATSTDLALRLRNTGKRAWSNDSLLPIRLGFQLERSSDGEIVAQERVPFDGTIWPNQVLSVTVPVQWPSEPGRYEILIELLREPARGLGELGRLPLIRAQVAIGDRPQSR